MAFARARQGHSTRTNVAYFVHDGNARRVAARAYMDASTAIVHHHLGQLERAQSTLPAAPKSQDAGAAAVSPFPETCEALSHDATVKRNRRVRQRAAAGRHAHRRRALGRTLMAGGGLVLAALCALGAWAAMRCAR